MQTNLQIGLRWMGVTLLWAGISGCLHSISFIELQAWRIGRRIAGQPPKPDRPPSYFR
jgi:hypothetical protein